MKRFCRLIEFKRWQKIAWANEENEIYQNKKKHCSWNIAQLREAGWMSEGSMWNKISANKYCLLLFLCARGASEEIVVDKNIFFSSCTICIWLCNNNENWKQFLHIYSREGDLEIHNSITRCNENQILSLLRECTRGGGGGGCSRYIMHVFQYGSKYIWISKQ